MKRLIISVLLGVLLPSSAFATAWINGSSTCEAAMLGSKTGVGIPNVGYWYKDSSGWGRYITNSSNGSPNYYCFENSTLGLRYLSSTQVTSESYADEADHQGSCNTGYSRVVRRSKNVEISVSTIEDCPGYADTDGDGVPDSVDACPDTAQGSEVDSTGCPIDPAHCSDGGTVPTGDETGIDCGGSCGASCELVCSDGLEPISDPASPWFNKCYGGIFPLTSQGVCPPNTVLGTLGESCVGIDEPFNISSEFTPSEIASLGVPPTDYNQTGTNVFTDENSSWVSVDNGDGTSTETTTTTTAKTDSNGNDLGSETTTRTDIVNNTTSTIISSTISTTTSTTPDENPDNWLGFGDVSTGEYDGDITEDLPEESSITNLIDGFITTSPIFTALDTFEVQTSGAVCAIDLGTIYDKTITMDVCQWEDDLSTFGLLFLSIVQAYSLLVIYRGWK